MPDIDTYYINMLREYEGYDPFDDSYATEPEDDRDEKWREFYERRILGDD